MNNEWKLTPTEVSEMANSLVDAEATVDDAVRYGADRARWKLVDVMLREGFPMDCGEDEGYWIPLDLWHTMLNGGE